MKMTFNVFFIIECLFQSVRIFSICLKFAIEKALITIYVLTAPQLTRCHCDNSTS